MGIFTSLLPLFVAILMSKDSSYSYFKCFTLGCIFMIAFSFIGDVYDVIKLHISLSKSEINAIIKSSLTKKMLYKLMIYKPLIFFLSVACCSMSFLISEIYISHILSILSLSLYFIHTFYTDWEYKVGLCHVIDQNTGELITYTD